MSEFYINNPRLDANKAAEISRKVKQLIASNDNFEVHIVEPVSTAIISPLLRALTIMSDRIKIVRDTNFIKSLDEYEFKSEVEAPIEHKIKYDIVVRTSDKLNKEIEEVKKKLRNDLKTKFKYKSEVILMIKCFSLEDFKSWMKWHLEVLEFDHAVIVNNDSPVDIKSVCENYGDKVSYQELSGWPDQYHLYDKLVNGSSAEWVIPIDDDEYIFINSDKTINEFIDRYSREYPCMNKFSIEWLNLFPSDYLESRGNTPIYKLATSYNHDACRHWQCGNTQVKTFVNTKYRYEYVGVKLGHNPMCLNGDSHSYTCHGKRILGQVIGTPTNPDKDCIFLVHYQFRTAEEWERKCKLGSPGSRWFTKVKQAAKPEVYERIYKFKNKFNSFTKIKDTLDEICNS